MSVRPEWCRSATVLLNVIWAADCVSKWFYKQQSWWRQWLQWCHSGCYRQLFQSHLLCAPLKEADSNVVLHVGSSPMERTWAITPFHKEVSIDVSLTGWGALCHAPSVKGMWTAVQCRLHIKYFELLAAVVALRHVQIDRQCDSGFLHKQAGRKSFSAPLKPFLSLRATHVSGHMNLGPNLSRGSPPLRESRLHPSVVVQLWSRLSELRWICLTPAQTPTDPSFP